MIRMDSQVQPVTHGEEVPQRSVGLGQQLLKLNFILGQLWGIWPVKKDKLNITFKPFSRHVLFAFIRLILIGLPFNLLPVIFWHGGFNVEEVNNFLEAKNMSRQNKSSNYEGYCFAMTIVEWEYLLNVFYYILPFAFASQMAKPMTKILISFDEHVIEKKVYISTLIPPVFGFGCIIIGRILCLINTFVEQESRIPGFITLPINVYTVLSGQLIGHIGLQYILCFFEIYYYVYFSLFTYLTRHFLNLTGDNQDISRISEVLIDIADSFKKCFGFFLLADLTLMCVFWIIHLYMAFINFSNGRFLALFGNLMVILAEFTRVISISRTGERFTDNIEKIIIKLEETKTTLNENDTKVRIFIQTGFVPLFQVCTMHIAKLKNLSIMTANGFFSVNNGLATSFISTTLTYFIILIQFSTSSTSC
jgi:hypothetical protein